MTRRLHLTIREIFKSDPVSRVIATSSEGFEATLEFPDSWVHEFESGDAVVMDLSFQKTRTTATQKQTEDIDTRFMRLRGAGTK